jgi:predicted helicase
MADDPKSDNPAAQPPDDEQYIARLIGQVITVCLETMKVVKGLPTCT